MPKVQIGKTWVMTTPEGEEIPLWTARDREKALAQYWDSGTNMIRPGYSLEQRDYLKMIA